MNDFLTGKIRTVYMRYLAAAFGSALITSIYSIVDMAMVGHYQGPEGTAALAVVAPVWNVIYSLGLLMGIGGSVIFSAKKGATGRSSEEGNRYFTAAVLGAVVLALMTWLALVFFDTEILQLFGATEQLLPLAQAYILPIKFVVPFFLFNQMLAAFLRNDNSPGLAAAAILLGGVVNIVGDYFFVFTCDMGIFGAGLATAIGSTVSFVCLLLHFFMKHNTLKLVRPVQLFRQLRELTVIGFSTFFVDVAMGILTILFNRQIVQYLGTDALAIYGVIVNVSTFVQCCAYSAGQAAQPIISVNYGANQSKRIKETLKYGVLTAGFFSLIWTGISVLAPLGLVAIFMTPSPAIADAAPMIIRTYGLSFLLLPFNIVSTYYFQAIMKPKLAFLISVLRGLVISGALIYLLPLWRPSAIWLAMPLTELLVAVVAVCGVVVCTKELTTAASDKKPSILSPTKG